MRLGVDLRRSASDSSTGITIGTNAILEGRGAQVWMLTTAGFRDVLEIARTNRTVLYDITDEEAPASRSARAYPRDRGTDDLGRPGPPSARPGPGAGRVGPPAGRAAAVAVCFLHSYANPDHERVVALLVAGVAVQRGSVPAPSSSPHRARCCRSFGSTSVSTRPPSMPTSGPSSTGISRGSRRRSRSAGIADRCSS